MKLDVGAGDAPEPGFTTLDAFAPADLTADMTRIPVASGTVEALNCSHALEHLDHRTAGLALAEFCRVLEPRGTLRIVVPDLDHACRWWLDAVGTDRGAALKMIYGSQSRPGQYHLSGWNRWTLQAAAEQAGFEVRSVAQANVHGTVCVVLEAFVP